MRGWRYCPLALGDQAIRLGFPVSRKIECRILVRLGQVQVASGNRQFVAQYLRDARSEVLRFALDGKPIDRIELPGIGTTAGFNGKSDATETFYSYTSYTVPTDIYRLDLTTGQSTLFRRPKVAFDSSQYETRQVRYTSKDGGAAEANRNAVAPTLADDA